MIFFTEKIKFINSTSIVSGRIGDILLLPCEATGQPRPEMSWRFRRRKIPIGKCENLNDFCVFMIMCVMNQSHINNSRNVNSVCPCNVLLMFDLVDIVDCYIVECRPYWENTLQCFAGTLLSLNNYQHPL